MSMTQIPSTISPPCWLDKNGKLDVSPPFPASEVLAFRNGLLHMPSFVDGLKPDFIQPTPRFFNISGGIPFHFEPNAPAPVAWLAFLKQLWPDDEEQILALQCWFGYVLSSSTAQQKILLIIGPKRSGKGTIARVLTSIIGEKNVAAPTLAGLGTNFGMSGLVGKSLAIIADARLSGRTDSAIVTERLLSISGEDLQTIDRKYNTLMTLKLGARFMLLTNEMPRFSDSSGALVSRFICLETRKSFIGNEDVGLTDRLTAERAGILLWAIEGWRMLKDSGRLLNPKSSQALLEDFDDLVSPINAFLRECCDVEPGRWVYVDSLFKRYLAWCEDNERQAVTKQTFGRDLRAAGAIQCKQCRNEDGKQARYYDGVDLKAVSIP